MTKLADLIWKNAELLRGAYKEDEYRTVIRSDLQCSASAAAAKEGLEGKRAATLGAKAQELARKHLGQRDKAAQPATDERGDALADSERRDAAYVVPYGTNLDTYLEREVSPHWPDAWINREITSLQDGVVGMVNTEINCNTEFFVYAPLRRGEEIHQDIEAKETRLLDLLGGVRA